MVPAEKSIPVLLFPQNPTQSHLGSKVGLCIVMVALNHGTTP
jgi:hypothetical protein